MDWFEAGLVVRKWRTSGRYVSGASHSRDKALRSYHGSQVAGATESVAKSRPDSRGSERVSFRVFVEEAFEGRFLELPPDHRMHYIDEGEGEPIVFVHGNPAWSFEFRHPVRELRSEHRCVALDHRARTVVPRVTRTAWPLCSHTSPHVARRRP